MLIIRTDELFSIIVDYPDSISALEDLRVSQIQSQANGRNVFSKWTCAVNSWGSYKLRELGHDLAESS